MYLVIFHKISNFITNLIRRNKITGKDSPVFDCPVQTNSLNYTSLEKASKLSKFADVMLVHERMRYFTMTRTTVTVLFFPSSNLARLFKF